MGKYDPSVEWAVEVTYSQFLDMSSAIGVVEVGASFPGARTIWLLPNTFQNLVSPRVTPVYFHKDPTTVAKPVYVH